MLRALAIAAGICSAILFVVIGLSYELQLYGDGALFSYSVAAQDAWAFHWHNISGRIAVFFFCMAPAQAFVALTGDPGGGIVLYGLIFFASPLLGLIATYFADRSRGRIIFSAACFSTAALCPLVFGFPTEMWLTHALFWPTLAASHYARQNVGGAALVFVLMLALMLTHEGAIIFAIAIVATLLLRNGRDTVLLRGSGAVAAAMVAWGAVKLAAPPGDYFAGVLERAALNFFDIAILEKGVILQLFAALAGYGIIFFVLKRIAPAKAHIYTASIVAVALTINWLWLDHSLHAASRYYMRTVLTVATPMFGVPAALYALRADGRLALPIPMLPRIMNALASTVMTRALAGAFMVVMLVHAVETAKFLTAWAKYKSAIAALATGVASDPALGDPRFVTSVRIGPDLNRLAWNSTTQFLSVILTRFAPARLVVDPLDNYFWLSCRTATASLNANRAVPAETRQLLQIHACLHR
jgi:hypothetical protein